MTRRTRKNIPKGYDSWLEYDLQQKLTRCCYHPDRISYIQRKTYEPDFKYEEDEYVTYIEAKGRFRDRSEARKYIDVRDSLGDNEDIVFIFQNPKTAMPGARRRADGTRLTMADWADKHEFQWYTVDNLPLRWRHKTK